MLRLFRPKSKREKLNQEYKKLMAEAYQLSSSNRTAADEKTAKANAILDQIDALKED